VTLFEQPLLPGLAPVKPTRTARPRSRRAPRPQVAADAPVRYTTGVDGEGRRQWTLAFPAPAEMISVNGNPPWRKTSPVRKTWREAVFVHAKAAKLPTGLRQVRIDLELRFPKGGRRDPGNYHAHVAKPAVDAFGPPINTVRAGKPVVAPGYGLIPDDTPEYLDGPFVRLGPAGKRPGAPFGEVTITITELEKS
jgi:hypothetical protein